MRTLFIAVLAALALPAAAAAGGWATAGISPPPDGGEAGETKTFQITVLRHGRTPTDGAAPAVVLTNPDTGEQLTFPGKPAGPTGKYTARVEWPAAGTWKFGVSDGLEATGYGISTLHTYGTVDIVGGGGGSGPGWTIGGSIVLALALGALLLLGLRRRRPAAAPIPAPTGR